MHLSPQNRYFHIVKTRRSLSHCNLHLPAPNCRNAWAITNATPITEPSERRDGSNGPPEKSAKLAFCRAPNQQHGLIVFLPAETES